MDKEKLVDFEDIIIDIIKATSIIIIIIFTILIIVQSILDKVINPLYYLMFILIGIVGYMLLTGLLLIVYKIISTLYLDLCDLAIRSKQGKAIKIFDSNGWWHYSIFGFTISYYSNLRNNHIFITSLINSIVGTIVAFTVWCLYVLIFNKFDKIFDR